MSQTTPFRHHTSCLLIVLVLFLTSCQQPTASDTQSEIPTSVPEGLPVPQVMQPDSIFPAADSQAVTEQAEPDPSWFEASIMGTGIISIADDADQFTTQFRFYDDKGSPLANIRVSDKLTTTVVRGKEYRDFDTSHPWAPRFFDPEPHYFKIYFDVLGTEDGYYKVLLNRNTGQVGYIKRDDKNFRFQTVDAFVKERAEAGIEFHISKNPLRKQPNDKAETVAADPQNKFSWRSAEKLGMRGDWMQVRLETKETGWIRWRKGRDILVRLIYRC